MRLENQKYISNHYQSLEEVNPANLDGRFAYYIIDFICPLLILLHGYIALYGIKNNLLYNSFGLVPSHFCLKKKSYLF